MTTRHLWAAAATAVAVLNGAPAQAQGGSCDGGRGGRMTDLGFDAPSRSMRVEDGRLDLHFDSEPRITGVRRDGPAAGRLREGDVLVAVDGQPITARAGARRYAQIRPGERVRLSVRRGGDARDVTITAGARCIPLAPDPPRPPAPPQAPPAPAAPLPPAGDIMPAGWFGFALECRNCGQDENTGVFRFHEPPVVVDVEPESPAARAGLRPGDRLTHVDGLPLTGAAGWPRFYAIQPGEEVRFTYTRSGRAYHATISALPRP